MTMITPSYLGETIEYSSLHACRSTLEDPKNSSPVLRCCMSTLFELLIVWGVLTAALIALLIYRGTLTMQEDDQLFLGESESHMAREQMEIMNRVQKLAPFVKVLGTASAVLILTIAGVALYQKILEQAAQ